MNVYHCVVKNSDGFHTTTTVSGQFKHDAAAKHLLSHGFELVKICPNSTDAQAEADQLNAAASETAQTRSPVTAESIVAGIENAAPIV